MEKIIIDGFKYTVIGMEEQYPFGGIQETPDQDHDCLVKKKLRYQSEADLNILNNMAALLQNLDNQYLIKLVHAEADREGTCQFFYEYAPLTVSTWVLDMGEELLKELQLQLMNLASYLAKNGVKFAFNPQCVGLSRDIKIKYFLAEFSIDYENKFVAFKENQKKILEFFEELKCPQKEETADNTRQTVNSSGYGSSVRESWQIKSWKSVDSDKEVPVPQTKTTLADRLQSTKQKSLQILNRLKGLKPTSTRSKE